MGGQQQFAGVDMAREPQSWMPVGLEAGWCNRRCNHDAPTTLEGPSCRLSEAFDYMLAKHGITSGRTPPLDTL